MDKRGAPDKTVMRLSALGKLKTEIDEIGATLRKRFEEYGELSDLIHTEDQIASATKFKDEIINAAWNKFEYPNADVIPSMATEDDIVHRIVQ